MVMSSSGFAPSARTSDETSRLTEIGGVAVHRKAGKERIHNGLGQPDHGARDGADQPHVGRANPTKPSLRESLHASETARCSLGMSGADALSQRSESTAQKRDTASSGTRVLHASVARFPGPQSFDQAHGNARTVPDTLEHEATVARPGRRDGRSDSGTDEDALEFGCEIAERQEEDAPRSSRRPPLPPVSQLPAAPSWRTSRFRGNVSPSVPAE
jgi:hypothetical protein